MLLVSVLVSLVKLFKIEDVFFVPQDQNLIQNNLSVFVIGLINILILILKNVLLKYNVLLVIFLKVMAVSAMDMFWTDNVKNAHQIQSLTLLKILVIAHLDLDLIQLAVIASPLVKTVKFGATMDVFVLQDIQDGKEYVDNVQEALILRLIWQLVFAQALMLYILVDLTLVLNVGLMLAQIKPELVVFATVALLNLEITASLIFAANLIKI